jgi:hypothetical protein
MGTNPNFVREHAEQILDEVKTAIAAQCDCMKGGCPHDLIRELPYLDGVQHAAFPEVRR